jgi:hypothetical protein
MGNGMSGLGDEDFSAKRVILILGGVRKGGLQALAGGAG